MAFAAITGCVLTARGSDDPDQTVFPQITAQPTDQDVAEGESTTFTVEATNGELGYQWLRDGVAIEGQTNNSLTVGNVGINDVGLYSCNVSKETETVPTRAASLNVSALSGGEIFLYGTPVRSGGSSGSCPGAYAGYVNYTKSAAQGWGWAPSTNTSVHTATDTTRSDTKVQYLGKSSDKGCSQTTVSIPNPPYSTKYRFTIYFTNNVPTNAYSITLSGFDP
jgi:hypothetical protein